ncbi:MAG: hypothetical protein ACR2RE_06310 [Geminicoccaceae bacterium]
MFTGEDYVAGATGVCVSRSVDGRRRIFGLADDSTHTGQGIDIPDEPQFLARLCAELMRPHIDQATELDIDRHEGVFELAAARRRDRPA